MPEPIACIETVQDGRDLPIDWVSGAAIVLHLWYIVELGLSYILSAS